MSAKLLAYLGLLSSCFLQAANGQVCAPVTAGLVGWWSAEGDAADNLGVHNGQASGVQFVPGIRGQAFQFDGVNSRVSVPDAPAFELTNSLTIEAWLNINTFLGAQIFFRGDARPGLDPFYLSAEPGQRVAFVIMNEANQYEVLYAQVPGNAWFHVAAVLDGQAGTMTIYVNGALAAQTNTQIRPFARLDPFADPGVGIGNHAGTSHNFPFNGLVDELALFDRSLSEAEIRSIYQAGVAGKCSPVAPCTVETLVERIESSDLPARRKHPLLVTLAACRALLDRGQTQNAAELLRAFEHKVRAQVTRYDEALATALIACSQEAIQLIANSP
jgi:hypothetical protein